VNTQALPGSPDGGSFLRRYNARPIGALYPYERNARTHSPEQVEQIAASIREFGFTNPVLVTPDGGILAGHGRVLAAASLGWTEVPCLELGGLTPAQQRALVLADNQLALNAGWDVDVLASELRALGDAGYDLGVLGFSVDELAELLKGPDPVRDPDEAPALRGVATSVQGDVWILGAHRVVVGDATLPGPWDALMGRELADVCWTDPPYNVNYTGAAGSILNDHQQADAFLAFLTRALSEIRGHLKPGGAIYCAHADTEGLAFRQAFQLAGFKLSGVVIWRKDALVLGRSDYQWIHEPILYGWRPGSAHRWYGGRKNTTFVDLGTASPFTPLGDGRWQVTVGDRMFVVEGSAQVTELVPSVVDEPRPRSSVEHPTMKPVALIERQLKHNARTGDLVVDPFGGSGSTLIAADRLGMSARLMELDPHYADVIVRRWQQYTGRAAVHAVTGLPFGD
jgi:DNA modification methylase